MNLTKFPLIVFMLFTFLFINATTPIQLSRRPITISHGATRAPIYNSSLDAIYDEDLSIITVHSSHTMHTFVYKIHTPEGLCIISNNESTDEDGIADIDVSNLPTGNYTLEIQMGQFIYEGEFLII